MTYEKKAEEYITYPTWLDNAIACIHVDVSSTHKAEPLWKIGKHWSLGAPRQLFEGCGGRPNLQRGFFTLVREIECLKIPSDFAFELHVNDKNADGVYFSRVGQRIRHQYIEELYFTNTVAKKDEYVLLLLKGLKFPEK